MVVDAVIWAQESHEAIAAELGIQRSTVTTRLLQARKKLAALAEAFLPPSQR